LAISIERLSGMLAQSPNRRTSLAGEGNGAKNKKGATRQYGYLVNYWYYYLNLVATGITRLESRRSDPYSTCYRSHFHNPLAIEKSVQTFLTIPAFT
jgi:hypothetical protein